MVVAVVVAAVVFDSGEALLLLLVVVVLLLLPVQARTVLFNIVATMNAKRPDVPEPEIITIPFG